MNEVKVQSFETSCTGFHLMGRLMDLILLFKRDLNLLYVLPKDHKLVSFCHLLPKTLLKKLLDQ